MPSAKNFRPTSPDMAALNAPVRNTERFKAFARKVGMVDYWRGARLARSLPPHGRRRFRLRLKRTTRAVARIWLKTMPPFPGMGCRVPDMASLLAELKRRNISRVAAAYAVTATKLP